MSGPAESVNDASRGDAEPMRILSLGAGVQSSTLLLMAAKGEVGPMPDAAIFADTQWEREATYKHLHWLTGADFESWVDAEGRERWRAIPGVYHGGEAGVPVHVVTAGDIRAEVLEKNTRYASPPFHLLNLQGGSGMTRRQCTKGYKIEPIEKRVREILGIVPRSRGPRGVVVERWFGISADELGRMRASEVRWQTYRYPLIEANMTRHSCVAWTLANGFPLAPRSSCRGCPYHSNTEWRSLRDEDPDGWDDAVDFDRRIRLVGLKGLNATPFLHRSLVPLDEVDLSTAEERGQGNLFDDGMQQECEGMCGV